MGCFLSTLRLLAPRFVFLVYWLTPLGHVRSLAAFNTWIWPLLGLIFLPWTTLAYTLLYRPTGLFGFDWFWLALAFFADMSIVAAEAARRRDASWYPST